MSRLRHSRAPRLRRALAPAALLLLAMLALAPAANAAEGERLLEPRLSLTGGCGTTSVDPIPDPGLCPLEKEGGPGVPGVDHPPNTFSDPRAVATDLHGNIYVSSFGGGTGAKGRVDIFCSDGTFISELAVPGSNAVAIDSEGSLYVYSDPVLSGSEFETLRFKPNVGYNPEACEIEYGDTAPVLITKKGSLFSGLTINRDNDHLFQALGSGVVEYTSAEEGNIEVGKTPAAVGPSGVGVAVDAARDRMYASAGDNEERIDIFDLTSAVTPGNYEKVGEILESSVPSGELGTGLSIAANEGNGNVFVLDGENCNLYEFDQDGGYIQTIAGPPPAVGFLKCIVGLEIAVDNGPESPNGQKSEEREEGRFLYVPSDRTGIGHSYAFFLSVVGPPEVESTAVANISGDGAELTAQLNPHNLPTTYSFEYKVKGAPTWTSAGGGALPTGNDAVEVSAPLGGLSPGTSYEFRLSATNEAADPINGGKDQAEGSFATYPLLGIETGSCPNALLRAGPSALLPDCRAYELVSPGDSNARAPVGVGRQGGVFTTRQVSPAGDKIPFRVEGGSLPGLGGTGALFGDPYLATRTSAGWSTSYTGPAADEATDLAAGATSSDQGYLFWQANGRGSAVLGGETAYLRYPDGHSELLGQGSLGKSDTQALGRLLSVEAGHVVFSTGNLTKAAVQLEPLAAPDGTKAIYDRTPDGVTHVVSLKPGDEPLGAGENASYRGASLDGIGIAFEVGAALYLRYDNEATFAIGTGVEAAGVAEGGNRIFYVEGGDLMRFDALAPEGERVTPFTTTGDATPVTVSADGSTAYFVSPSVLGGANPEGDSAQAGEENVYRSVEGQIDFVATVTERDVDGEEGGNNQFTDGLGLWVAASSEGTLGRIPARSTPDGDAFLFKSRAALTGYDPEGHAQIYRYAAGALQCLSCIPTGAPAGSDATLQSESRDGQDLFSPFGWPENLRADGRRAFFESSERLVARDTDGRRDVYEWEDQGVGSCTRPGGCVYLISSPNSPGDEYLWAVSPSGDDAFFLSPDQLDGADVDATPSIYDARVGGGFPQPRVAAECLGEACQPSVAAPSAPIRYGGNVKQSPPARSCSQGARKAKRLARRAKRLRRAARRAANPRAGRKLRRKAARGARQARRLTKKAKRCRQQRRRAKR